MCGYFFSVLNVSKIGNVVFEYYFFFLGKCGYFCGNNNKLRVLFMSVSMLWVLIGER